MPDWSTALMQSDVYLETLDEATTVLVNAVQSASCGCANCNRLALRRLVSKGSTWAKVAA